MPGDIAGYIAVAATAAGGALSLAKLIKAMQAKRLVQPQYKAFPNGERDEFIAQLDTLKVQRRSDHKQLVELQLAVAKICERLGIET